MGGSLYFAATTLDRDVPGPNQWQSGQPYGVL